MTPLLWIIDPDQFQFRVEFRFVSPGGSLLASKTWAICQRDSDPPRTYLLQARARLADPEPDLHEWGQNNYLVTVKVSHLEGELNTAMVAGNNQAALKEQLASFPLSLLVIVDTRRLGFQLHLNPKNEL